MKGAAELLGVSYGTLYGRYRELFGYVKHAWNLAGRPMKLFSVSSHLGLLSGGFTKEPSAAIWTDPSNQEILEQLKHGLITINTYLLRCVFINTFAQSYIQDTKIMAGMNYT